MIPQSVVESAQTYYNFLKTTQSDKTADPDPSKPNQSEMHPELLVEMNLRIQKDERIPPEEKEKAGLAMWAALTVAGQSPSSENWLPDPKQAAMSLGGSLGELMVALRQSIKTQLLGESPSPSPDMIA